jgi:acyl carrier protein
MEERIRQIMSKVLGVPAETITSDASNETIPGWDSLGHMNLCLALEEAFSLELDGDHVASMTSFKAVVEAVTAAQQNR